MLSTSKHPRLSSDNMARSVTGALACNTSEPYGITGLPREVRAARFYDHVTNN
jgi:hypothetical protein